MAFSIGDIGAIMDIGQSRHWTARRLQAEIDTRSSQLRSLGIGPNSIVAVVHGGTPGFFADLLAIWFCGAAAACIDPSVTDRELETLIRFLQPELVVHGPGERPQSAGVPARQLSAIPAPSRPAEIDVGKPFPQTDEPCLILFTSGTTGQPKGVVHSFRSISTRLALNIEEIGRSTLERTLLTLPTHFGHGLIGNALTALFTGGELVIPAKEEPLGRQLGTILEDRHITFLTSVPALWRLATRFSAPPRSAELKRIHVGSAPLTASLWNEIVEWSGAEVVNCYGMTETANWISGASSRDTVLADGLVGRMWGGDVAVLGPDRTIRCRGEGEILLKSPSQMSGYLDSPEATMDAYVDSWFRTGDDGVVEPDGSIRLRGRLKDQINRAGFKIQPAEIDALLLSHPSIRNACAFAVPDEVAGEVLGIAIQLSDGASETGTSLRRWCAERVRRELVPERWFFVKELDVSSRGKLNRNEVRTACLPESDRV